jgi:hypothetical protein
MDELVERVDKVNMFTTPADEEDARRQSAAQQWKNTAKKWRNPQYAKSTHAREPQQQYYHDDESEEEEEKRAAETDQAAEAITDDGHGMEELLTGFNTLGTYNTNRAETTQAAPAQAAVTDGDAYEMNTVIPRKTDAEKLKERQMNTITSYLNAYPELKKKLTVQAVYNNPMITKNETWPTFTSTLGEFLRKKVRANNTRGPALRTTSFKTSHQSAKPPTIEPDMRAGGNKSRRNTHRRRKSKKQKRVRHTRRKKTRRHRHSRRR